MNSNRGQYNASPMYNMKKRRPEQRREADMGPSQPASRASRRHGWLSVLLSVVLPVFFLVALMVQNNTVRWAFLAVTGLSVLLMWVLRAFVRSARNTLTVVYLALAAVVGLALFINRQAPESRRAAAASAGQTSLFSNTDAGSMNAMLNEMSTPAPEAEARQAEAEPEAQVRMEAFFKAWAGASVSEMKEFCLPSWVKEQPKAENVLFQMLMNSIPGEPYVESMSVSDGSATSIITVKVPFAENGQTIVKRMHVIMKKVNDVWYVDPNSLDGVVVDEAAEAAAAASQVMIGTTIAPKATADPNGEEELILYYNTSGGKYYHTDKRCPAVATEYWPLTGKFPFSMINSKPYDQLKPCERCGAPARPAVAQ